ncbi:glycosyltransferase involved in cell wall biosynthesis [Okibacterium sp. HSC-33S16]|uniref:glycosyltransferase n=1 Tax=Okibacterium sp. HSC-33S16 TaxID=2910965 RepID=UPI00209E9028|nr:glycosyltransferase [Okibacterium sp. HSC-33S16]MCP2031558.1 glycosyltransferase involved in cell wall biosynthesis [Okibacterium sp. HSC-33S16]
MRTPANFPTGAILIPAHNEASVIDRTLRHLAPIAELDQVEVCVICNGCTDNTAERARKYPGVHVIEITEASKTAALNAGDAWATRWPRLYLDADIEIDPDAIARVFQTLSGSVPAARPLYRYDTSGASPMVRAYYRARRRMPSTRFALWGAGVYAISKTGHERFDSFPTVTADDLFVDRLFAPNEKHIVTTIPVRVRTPRTTAALLAILRRNQRGVSEFKSASSGTSFKELVLSVRGVTSALDALAYTALAALSRAPRLNRRGSHDDSSWERDESTRIITTRSVS